jgi:hypothetical protein
MMSILGRVNLRRRPCLNKNGWHKVIGQFNQRGKIIEVTTYDVHERKLGQASFDERGRVLRRTVFANAPSFGQPGQDVACYTAMFDDKGRAGEIAFFDEAGRPVRNKRGYARDTVTYDDKGVVLSHRYFGVDGQPVSTRIVIEQVLPDGQAHRLKLQVGDVLLRYDNRPVTQLAEYRRWRRGETTKDKPRPLVVLRNGETVTVQVAPARSASSWPTSRHHRRSDGGPASGFPVSHPNTSRTTVPPLTVTNSRRLLCL